MAEDTENWKKNLIRQISDEKTSKKLEPVKKKFNHSIFNYIKQSMMSMLLLCRNL